MATSSRSSSVVDLCEAADLDDATSRLFFSDIGGAGSGLSWPAASEIESTLTSQDTLVALCSRHGVPSELTPVRAQHLGWRACTPPPVGSNKMCVYAAAFDAGLGFPLHDFYARVLRRYHLAPSQLTPNAWSYLAAFVLLCRDTGVAPLVSAFRYFFTICAHRQQGKPTGYHHFQPYHDGTRRLFTGALPSRSGWKSRFFLDCPSGWICPVKWGKPKRADAREVPLTSMAIEKLKERVKETGCVDLKAFLASNEMPVGDSTALAPPQSGLKAEAGAAGVGAAAAENASTRKRSRLSPPAVLSQPQPRPTSAPAAGLAPIRASGTGGGGGHVPPAAGLAPIRASSTGGRSGHIPPPPGFAPIRASSTGGRSGHFPPPQQQGFSEAASAPPELARAQGVSIGGSREVSPPAPHTMSTSDALQLWEAMTKASEQAARIAKLNHELQLVKTWNTQWQTELRAAGSKHAAEIAELIARLHAANDRNNHLNKELVGRNKEREQLISHMNEELVRFNKEREQLIDHLRKASAEVAQLQAANVEVAQLKVEHAAESAELKAELAAEAKQLKEDLMEDAEQLRNEGYDLGARDMMNLALTMYKGVISADVLKVDLLHQGAASPLAVDDQ